MHDPGSAVKTLSIIRTTDKNFNMDCTLDNSIIMSMLSFPNLTTVL